MVGQDRATGVTCGPAGPGRPGRPVSPVVIVALCCAVAVSLLLHHGDASSPDDELVSGCDRLCQARNMIVKAKEALDNKAAAELMLLRVRALPVFSCCNCEGELSLPSLDLMVNVCTRQLS